jgi:hypothetical protein
LFDDDVDDTPTSMRDGPETGTARAASQPPFGAVPETEVVPASADPANVRYTTVAATGKAETGKRVRMVALPSIL